MLTIANLTYRIAGRAILEEASVSLPPGHRAGLVGRNGTGKSTLLKLIAGDLQPDAGRIDHPKGWRIGRLAQEAPGGAQTPLDCVLAADGERAALLAEAEHQADPERIAAIHTRLADIEAHSAEARAAAILHGLGFDRAAQGRPLGDFSGGWRMRVALAAQLFAAPDLLLLDEPTNHLDLEAGLWLEGFLKAWPKTLLIVSHERDLLNRIPTRIVHLAGGKLASYSGGYDDFEESRRQALALNAALAAKQEVQRQHMMRFVERFRAKASKARQAQSRLKAIARMKPIAAAVIEKGITLSFPEPEALAPPLLALDAAEAGYAPGAPVLSRLDLRVDAEDRIALLGANGNGKSTLLKLLAGRLAPLRGKVHRAAKLRVGYFAQHQLDDLDGERSPLAILREAASEWTIQSCRGHLARFGLAENQAETKVAALSGGEKARLALALLSLGTPHLLLLDEPSNHLDIDSRQALIAAINEFPGAVVLVSHDPHLIELLADRLWLVEDGRVLPFAEDLDSYRSRVLRERRGKERTSKTAPVKEVAAPEASQRAADLAVAAIDKWRAALALIETKLADPALYTDARATERRAWQEKHEIAKRRLAEAEDHWLAAAERLEA